MATKLKFPQGAARSFKLTFLRPDGDPEDLTGATFASFIKRSVADADALLDNSANLLALAPGSGTAVLSFDPAELVDLDPFFSKEWLARATLSDGRVLELDAHQGPLVFTPVEGDPDIAEPPNDYIEAYTPEDTMNNSITALITGLTGGTSVKLDGLTAGQLSALPSGTELSLFFTGSISVTYRLRARTSGAEAEVPAATGGFVILCDNDAARAWQLLRVDKQGQPCTWNADSAKWHRVWGVGADGAAVPAMDETGFALPT